MRLRNEDFGDYMDRIQNMGYITDPIFLVKKAMNMDGFSYNNIHNLERYIEIAEEVVERWTEMELDELGSSDYTFLLKEYLEELGLSTEFSPYLTIVKAAA